MRRPLTVARLDVPLLAACAGDDDQATPTGSTDTVTVVVTETVATTTDELQVEAGSATRTGRCGFCPKRLES
jgi:hypothetical protein